MGIVLALLTANAVVGTLGDSSADDKYLTIVQSELERVDGGLRQVADKRALFPVPVNELSAATTELKGSFTVTDNAQTPHTVDVDFSKEEAMYNHESVLDYIFVVTNTGNTNGYIRTWFAFEMGELTGEEFEKAIFLHKDPSNAWTWGTFEYGVMINGKRYAVVCAELKDALAASQTSTPALLQIMLRDTVSSDTVFRIDGNKDGKFEVMAYSRTVSDNGAWGDTQHPWK